MTTLLPPPTPTTCELAAGAWPDGCDWCGKDVPPHRERWCSDWCDHQWRVNHSWPVARKFAKRRDGNRCVVCGATEELEVNHILPLRGLGYSKSCWHHLDNLETRCTPCHEAVTLRQERMWHQ